MTARRIRPISRALLPRMRAYISTNMSTVSAAPQGRGPMAHVIDHDRAGEIVDELPPDAIGRSGLVEQPHDQPQGAASLVGGAGSRQARQPAQRQQHRLIGPGTEGCRLLGQAGGGSAVSSPPLIPRRNASCRSMVLTLR